MPLRKPGIPHSDHPGVVWFELTSKWMGTVRDRSVRVGKGPKKIHVGYFDDERACADAVATKRVEVDAAIAQKLHAMAQALPHTRGLPLRPKHPADAQPETAYYGEKFKGAKGSESKAFGPQRLVRVASKSRPGGFDFLPCCIATLDSGAPCTNVATTDGKHCNRHGGGFRVGEATGNGFCAHCKTMGLRAKRQPQHGGNGLCPACETHLKTEAAANGSDAPIKSRRWEDVVFDQLLPLITYADGTPFPPDQRDERRGGGLGTSSAKKRRRECDTTTNRFPDALWLLRDAHSRVILALAVEVDEDSHGDREPQCEVGKVEDTFQSVQERCKHEGAATGSAGRVDGYMIPVVVFRFNPNAYDKARVKLEDRVRVLADLVNSYAHMPAAEREALPTHGPIVHVLYYHSREGAQNLAHLRAVAPTAGWTLTVR
jgi:hypothetical protein